MAHRGDWGMSSTGSTPSASRRAAVVVVAFLALSVTLIAEATSEYMLAPIQSDMGLSVDETNRLALMPDTAGLIAVFLAGALAVRLGRRTVLSLGALSFAAGSIIVALAPGVQVLIAGRILCGLGGVILSVMGLSLINVTFTEPAQRARAFGMLGAVTPIVFIVSPTVSALICDSVGWRLVPAVWFAVALVTLGLALFAVPRVGTRPAGGEMVTPLLAGLMLTAVCTAASTAVDGGWLPVVALAVAVICAVSLVMLLRRPAAASLDLRSLKAPGALLALGAVFMALTVNISFYVNLYVQYRYSLPLASVALLLALPEIAGILGSILFGQVATRVGANRAATIALALAAVLPVTLFFVSPTAPVWLVVLFASLIGIPIAGAVGPLAENFLNLAPSDGSDGASAIQDAVTNVGFVLGGLAVGFLVFSGFQRSMTEQLIGHGVAPDRASQIATQIRDGAVVAELVDRAPPNESMLDEALLVEGSGLNIAQVQTLRLGAGLLMGAEALAAGLLVLSRRRQSQGAGGRGPRSLAQARVG